LASSLVREPALVRLTEDPIAGEATTAALGHADGGALLLKTYANEMPEAFDQARATAHAVLRSCEPPVSQAGS
jgi:hypothetical protein